MTQIDWGTRWLDTVVCQYKTHYVNAAETPTYSGFRQWFVLYPYGTPSLCDDVWRRFETFWGGAAGNMGAECT
jgi:hypothetical protein